MSATFTPCLSCARHVRQSDSTCPFCGNEVPHLSVPAIRVAVGRLSRSALFAASAAGWALATTDCSSSSPQPAYGGVDAGSLQPMYGTVAPPSFDAASEDAAPSDGGADGATVSPSDGGSDG